MYRMNNKAHLKMADKIFIDILVYVFIYVPTVIKYLIVDLLSYRSLKVPIYRLKVMCKYGNIFYE